MKNNQIRLVIVLGVLSILGIISVQVYWLQKAYDVKELQFNETIHTALQNVAENIAQENDGHLGNEDIISQLSSDYFVVNINDIIDPNTLEYYLSNEFTKFQVDLDYEFAIYDCKSNRMKYGKYVSVEDHKNNNFTPHELSTYDEYDYYFGVYFPTKSNFVVNNLRLSIVFSLILLIALVFFGYAMYVILQQKRLSELQTDFINNMTHEFKTPIASIALSSEVLLKTDIIKGDKRLFNYASIVKEQSERLNNQVEKVLQIAKLNTDEMALVLEDINLNDLLDSVIRSASVNYEKKNGNILKDFATTQTIIKADKMHLTNILFNLLDNSLKYNQNTPTAIVKTVRENNKLKLSVSDNGIGIESKYTHQLFEKFFRVPTGNVHNVKGFGLGLFYVKQVIDKHNWKIKVNSEPGNGTEIIIEIPLKKN